MSNKFKRVLQLILTFVMLCSFSLCFACSCNDNEEEEVACTYNYSICVGDQRKLEFYKVSNGLDFELENSNTEVISVGKNGDVKGLKEGSAIITQTYANGVVKYGIEVKPYEKQEQPAEEENLGVQEISILQNSIELLVSGNKPVTAIISNIQLDKIVWAQKDSTIVSIEVSSDKKTCTITGLKAGTTEVTISDGVITDIVKVVVREAGAGSDVNRDNEIVFDYTTISLLVNGSSTISAQTNLDYSKIVWSVSDSTVASITATEDKKSCVVTALKLGKVTVRATIDGKYAECFVTVKNETLQTLGTPTNFVINGNLMSWNKVDNAYGYQYSLDGGAKWEDIDGANTETYTFNSLYKAGKYEVQFRAKGDGISYKNGSSTTATLITSLYTSFDNGTKSLTWLKHPGVADYDICIDGVTQTTVTSGDYALNGEYATYVMTETLKPNSKINVKIAAKEGNETYNISSDLGVVYYRSGQTPLFKTEHDDISIKLNEEEVAIYKDLDNNIYFANGTNTPFTYGDKEYLDVTIGGKTYRTRIALVDSLLLSSGDTNSINSSAEYIDNGHTYFYPKYVLNADNSGRVENTAENLVVVVEGKTYTFDAVSISELGVGKVKSYYAKISDNKVYRITVGYATAVLNNEEEVTNMLNLTKHALLTTGKIYANAGGEYIALASDVNMAGKTPLLTYNPGSVKTEVRDWGFKGTFDGNGYTLYNLEKPLFVKLAGTLKNLGVVSRTSANNIIANQFFGKVDNCYFDIQVVGGSGNSYPISQYFTGVKVSNTVIKIDNQTTDRTVYPYGKECSRTDKESGKDVTLTGSFTSTHVFTNGSAPDVAPSTSPSVYGLDGTFSGSVVGFNKACWDLSGNQPVWSGKSSSVDTLNTYYHSQYVFNADKTAKLENPNDLQVTVKGNPVTIKNSIITGLSTGNSGLYVKAGNEFVYVSIKVVTAIINTPEELAKMKVLFNGDSYSYGNNQYIMLGGNIDMADITADEFKYGQLANNNETTWGFKGTFDGNGNKISNLRSYLFTHLQATAKIQNVTFENSYSGGGIAQFVNGGTFTNVHFKLDASVRPLTTMNFGHTRPSSEDSQYALGTANYVDCSVTVTNASDSFVGSFIYGIKSDTASVNLTNFKIKTNAGTFKFFKDQTTDYEYSGATDVTIASATLTKPVA